MGKKASTQQPLSTSTPTIDSPTAEPVLTPQATTSSSNFIENGLTGGRSAESVLFAFGCVIAFMFITMFLWFCVVQPCMDRRETAEANRRKDPYTSVRRKSTIPLPATSQRSPQYGLRIDTSSEKVNYTPPSQWLPSYRSSNASGRPLSAVIASKSSPISLPSPTVAPPSPSSQSPLLYFTSPHSPSTLSPTTPSLAEKRVERHLTMDDPLDSYFTAM